MSKYTIQINISDATLSILTANNWQLQVFKGVKSGASGKITLWQHITTFNNIIKLEWEDQYGGYVDKSAIKNGATIDVTSKTRPMEIGQRMTLNADSTVSLTTLDARADAFTFFSVKNEEWVCGVSQFANNAYSPLCVFNLYGHTANFIEPYDKVVLVFSTEQVDTGSVVEDAIGASVEVTLSPDFPTISLGYDINTSWATNGNVYAKVNPLPIALADALIIPF